MIKQPTFKAFVLGGVLIVVLNTIEARLLGSMMPASKVDDIMQGMGMISLNLFIAIITWEIASIKFNWLAREIPVR